jgi:hypothetical protein
MSSEQKISTQKISTRLSHALTRRKVAMSLSLVALLLLSASGFAQKGTVIKKQVRFAPGHTSTTLKGTAVWGTSYQYRVKAKAGQRMTIRLIGKPDFDFSLEVPPEADGTQPGGETTGVKKWSGILEDSGTYLINVSHTINGVTNAPYTLEITIN